MSLFSTSNPPPMLAANPSDLDGSGTINPASLNPSGAFSTPHLTGGQHLAPFSPATTTSADFNSEPKLVGLGTDSSPRGIKRSRSPEQQPHSAVPGEEVQTAAEEPVRRKRGRPPKNKGNVVSQSPQLPTTPSQSHQSLHGLQTPGQTHVAQPGGTPQLQHVTPVGTLASPPKTVTKPPTVKALPTVRDHTTDQLTPEGDEYIPREIDESGEKKVMRDGRLLGQREYKCRTFNVPNRGEKLFMLATECARVLGYRDSYLLFNKNRSLYKIIATQAEKDDLIAQELLPYSYRSRQIAIVTARSMFRQFGSRVIVNGRRVRDDYWETKARKQGFTEDDPAGEKRPGAKQRALAASAEAAQQQAQQQAQQASVQQIQHQSGQQSQSLQPQTGSQAQQVAPSQSSAPEPLFNHEAVQLDQHTQPQMVQPGLGGPAPPVSIAPQLPMIHVPVHEDRTPKELYSVQRPRQEITGPPYQDRTAPAPVSQMMDQAAQAAEFNKNLTQSRAIRSKSYIDHFKRSPPQQQLSSPPVQQHHGPPPQLLPPAHQSHPQMQPPMMSPQQLSSLNHQQPQHPHQPHPQQQQHHQPLHPSMLQTPTRPPSQGIKPEQLHAPPPGPSNYLPSTGYYHPQQQQQPTHPQQHPRGPMPGHHQAMSPMHMQHPQQNQMYPPATPQQYMQQQQQPPPPQAHPQYQQQGYRPPPPPQQQPQQQQWWSGA